MNDYSIVFTTNYDNGTFITTVSILKTKISSV